MVTWMLFLLLPGLVMVNDATKASDMCMQLKGIVQDHASRKPLSARLYLRTATGRIELGSSNAQGRFSVNVACAAPYLLVECTGYRTQQLYLNPPTTTGPGSPVGVLIPLVAVDAQDTDKPYLQAEQHHFEQARSGQVANRPQRNLFTISDALTGRLLPAQSCFVFTNTGTRRCLNANAKGQLSISFDRKDIVAMEVSAPGYQTYSGNLIVEALDGRQLQHTVRLTRELTLLSVRLMDPGDNCSVQHSGTGQERPLIPLNEQPLVWVATDLLPQAYTLIVRDGKGAVREKRMITLQRGLNVVQTTDRRPVAAPQLAAPVPTEAVSLGDMETLPTLYFGQGSYEIQPANRTHLLQMAAYLQQHPDKRLEIIGHADREGDEALNRLLSENRARVVANFFITQGIPDRQLEVKGVGSRYLVSPSDTEDNKARNRRVQLKVISNQKS